MPKTGYFHNGVPIPVPPDDVLALQRKYDEPVYLILFFDTKRTWQVAVIILLYVKALQHKVALIRVSSLSVYLLHHTHENIFYLILKLTFDFQQIQLLICFHFYKEQKFFPLIIYIRNLLYCRQWLPRNKLEPLGVDSGLDKAKLLENKKPNVRKAVQKAYEKAILHRCSVTGEPNPLSGDSELEDQDQGQDCLKGPKNTQPLWEILLKFLIDLSLYAEVFEKYPSLRKILLIQISGIKIRVGGLGLEVKMSAVFVRTIQMLN